MPLTNQTGKFSVVGGGLLERIAPKPTAAESRRYHALLESAVEVLDHLDSAVEVLRIDERDLKRLPRARRGRFEECMARAESALLQIQDEMEELVKSDTDLDWEVDVLNELDRDAQQERKRPHKRCRIR
jgi:hypothetical protein